MRPIHLALFWHQHQPFYRDLWTGEFAMPWVRLHSAKDYLGMALLLEEVPEMRATINLVPSLLRQLEGYLAGDEDGALRLTRKPASDLAEEEQEYILDHFYSANRETMIHPYPRYRELLLRRQFGRHEASEVRRQFRPGDFLDLQVWFNLAWMGPLHIAREPALAALLAKGTGFTESDKHVLLDVQRRAMGEVIPMHKRLQESGQVELTTSPYFHPILPLLVDPESAREAMPGALMPDGLVPLVEDAKEQLRLARQAHERWFGKPPRGIWPSEGSVSQSLVPILLDAGFEWAATDEEILFASLGIEGRDGSGNLRNPGPLHRAWAASDGSRRLSLVFRDHWLSDFIGFQAQRMIPEEAVSTFLARLAHVSEAAGGDSSTEPLVAVILDGENAWEYYPDNAVPFLRTLYRRIAQTSWIRPTTISAYLDSHARPEPIGRLFAGSWIHHDFYIWIGHEEDRQAWKYLYAARSSIRDRLDRLSPGEVSDANLGSARDSLFAAEGSDWFWWYGDDHSSGHDEEFDALFRTHLANAHRFVGLEPPPYLGMPIARPRPAYRMPTEFVRPSINGRSERYFEWTGAGKYASDRALGAVARSSRTLLRTIYFGFDSSTLYLRFDTRGDARLEMNPSDEIEATIVQPVPCRMRINGVGRESNGVVARLLSEAAGEISLNASADQVIEVACPFDALGFEPGKQAEFYVEVHRGGRFIERHPQYGTLAFPIPTPEFESEQWQV